MSLNFLQTKEEREQKSIDYIAKLFPFGIEQRDKVKSLMDEMYPTYVDSNMLFSYIVAKEHYIENKKDLGLKTAYKYLKRIRPRLSKDDTNKLFLLILLELEMSNLDNFPTAIYLNEKFSNYDFDNE